MSSGTNVKWIIKAQAKILLWRPIKISCNDFCDLPACRNRANLPTATKQPLDCQLQSGKENRALSYAVEEKHDEEKTTQTLITIVIVLYLLRYTISILMSIEWASERREKMWNVKLKLDTCFSFVISSDWTPFSSQVNKYKKLSATHHIIIIIRNK